MNCTRDTEKFEGGSSPDVLTILLVEDDDAVRELLAIVLRGEGYDVIELGDGMEALNYLAAAYAFDDTHACPDLIVSDIQMPMFTGLDLLVGMAECSPLPPLILFTGLDDPELFAEAYRLGAKRVLKKPFAPDVLCKAIGDVLEESLKTLMVPHVVQEVGYDATEHSFF